MNPPMLTAHEARLFGVLVEKSLTTPENYPLSLNAAASGANQKSNRDPVLELVESEVYDALRGLIRKGYAGASHPSGGRVEKFRHNGQAVLELDDAGLAVVAELLMRGAQTPGELRQRASRMAPIDSTERLTDVLRPLLERGLVQRLPPSPGSRAERYEALLVEGAQAGARPAAAAPARTQASPSAPAAPAAPSTTGAQAPAPHKRVNPFAPEPEPELEERVKQLDDKVAMLQRQLRTLAWELGKELKG
jgi:uncharacterized protein YceH (UPF0502 family)